MSLNESTPEEVKEVEVAETDWMAPLKYEDIEEKIRINLADHKITLPEFRMRLQIELHDLQRTKLKMLIQEQNYKEQLDYIDFKLNTKLRQILNLKKE